MSDPKKSNQGPLTTPEQAGLEDKFFGQPNVLGYQESDIGREQQVNDTLGAVRGAVDAVHDPNDPANVIDRLQTDEKLPESLHTSALVRTLRFLGKIGLKIQIEGGIILFPSNRHALSLSLENLSAFLKKGALAASFLVPLASPLTAFAQPLKPGMDLLHQEGAKVINQGIEGNTLFHWEYLALLLLLFGLGGLAVRAIVQKLKKDKLEKTAEQHFNDYQAAKKTGKPEEIAQAKQNLFVSMMGELPTEMDEALQTTDIETQDELEKALAYKRKADNLVNKAIAEIENAMVLPSNNTVEGLNKIRREVLSLFDQYDQQLKSLYDKLFEDWKKIEKVKGSPYLLQHLHFEKQKLLYIINYLAWMKKKWALLLQGAKNELITDKPKEELDLEDTIQKDIHELKEKLNDLLDSQATQAPDDFKAKLEELDQALDEKINAAEKNHLSGYEKDEKFAYGAHIVLPHGGEYDNKTGIDATINGQPIPHIELLPKATAQIWINEKNEIHINFNFNGVLVDTEEFLVFEGDFHVKKGPYLAGASLADYIALKQDQAAAKKVKPAEEIAPEGQDIVNAVSSAVVQIQTRIKAKEYKFFGVGIEADDEAIDYHYIRVHQEFHDGKPKTAIRFSLTESYWKKALAGLHKQKDIPKHTVYFNFEGPGQQKKHINQPMLRFNVLVGKKQATVLIPADDKYKALEGEVRILFDADKDYTPEEISYVFTEASKRLGIQGDIKPVTIKAREKLQQRIKKIRKEDEEPVDRALQVHKEYKAEQVGPVSVEKLQTKGLHSLYHQFDMSILEEMFKTGTLLSTATRWAKGILKDGMSSLTDLSNGGGREVYMRIHTKKSLNNWGSSEKPAVIFAPGLFNRMDCYCYASDKYGSKLPDVFSQRVSPEKLVGMMNANYNSGHEVMFHDAVDLRAENAAYVVCSSASQAAEVKARLKQIGVTNIGKKTLEQAVITRSQFQSVHF